MATTKRKRRPKARAVHAIFASTQALYMTALVDRKHRVLCGKPLYYKIDGALVKARELTARIWENGSLSGVTCTGCLKLARLTPTERAQALADAEDQKRRAFQRLQANTNEARDAMRSHRQAVIDAARIDALVCLDAFENGREIKRCNAPVGSSVRCNLPADGHTNCRARLEGEPKHIDLGETLAVAIDAYKMANQSGGERLIVFVNGARECRTCHRWTEDPGASYCQHCPKLKNISTLLPKFTPATLRDVCCRFCRVVLGKQCSPFKDYSHALFNVEGANISRGCRSPSQRYANDARALEDVEVVDVWKHTVVCALRYLAGVQQTNYDDEPIIKPRLPAESFTLEHDR